MNSLILGNAISFIAAVFLCLSCVAKTKRSVAALQLTQCLFNVIAQIAFGKGSGAVSMSAAATRNLLIATGHYGVIAMIIISLFTLVLGLYFNTAGLIGLMPVSVGIFYTVSLYFVKDVRTLKCSLAVLLFVWIVYSALIFDVFGTISNTLAQILNLITLSRLKKEK